MNVKLVAPRREISSRRLRQQSASCIAAAVFATLAACGGKDPGALVASARTYLERDNPRAAVVELKNALQTAPDSAEARFLLGKALLESGEGDAAIVELNKAVALKYPADFVIPQLAHALNATGQFRKLTQTHADTKLNELEAVAELKSAVAAAYALQGERDAAHRQLALSLEASPANRSARLLQARFQAADGDSEGALVLAGRILKDDPLFAEAWQFRGDVLWRVKVDLTSALEAYRKALAARPGSTAARTGIVGVLLAQGDSKGAATDLAELRKAAPTGLQVKWFDAQIAIQAGNYKEGKRLADQLISRAPDDIRVLYLAAVADYQLGNYAQAVASLSKALQAAAESVEVRRLLANAHLRLGQPTEALEVALHAPEQRADGELQSIAGQASLMLGDLAKAQAYFASAAQANPTDARSKTALALVRLTANDDPSAIVDLKDLAAQDTQVVADLALITALLGRNDTDAALKAIDRLEAKEPGRARGAYLRGNVWLARKDLATARESYERALRADPTYFLAAARLAALDIADKRPKDARQRLTNILAADPRNVQALVALADLQSANGGSKAEVVAWFDKAVMANSGDATARIRLIDYLLRGGDYVAALAAAQSAIATLPDHPQVVEALGKVQLATGQVNQAEATFKRLVGLRSESPLGYLGLADVYTTTKNLPAASQSLQNALAVAPNSVRIQSRLMSRWITDGQTKPALELAQALQKQRPKDTIGYIFEGDVLAAQKKWSDAVEKYRVAHRFAASTGTATKLHAALLASAQSAAAAKLSSEWLDQNPGDTRFLSYLGDASMISKDYVAAQARYEQVLHLAPDQPSALNNVAWLMVERGQRGALPLAEKANRLQPDNPAFLDTLAKVLARENQLSKALEVQRKVVALQPQITLFRLHLVEIHIQQGDKLAARRELDRLPALDKASSARIEADRLNKLL